MLHTKFLGNRPVGSGEEGFLKGFYHIWAWRPSFEQTMMGLSPRCYISSFVEIGLPVPEKKIFRRAFTIYGCGGHLGHVTSIMSSYFHFLVPESFHTKFGSDRHSSF